MRTILLTSAGMQVKEEILKLISKDPCKIKVAYIITAAKPSKNIDYVQKDRQIMQNACFKVTDIDIEGKKSDELKEILVNFDIIYVQGGNTFYLLKAVKESGFDLIVKDLINQGIIYIGVSAGSVICGPTIETTNWKNVDKNIVNLKKLNALSLVPFNLFVHYEPKLSETVKNESSKSDFPTRVLTDDQAILFKDGEIKLVGKGKEILVD